MTCAGSPGPGNPEGAPGEAAREGSSGPAHDAVAGAGPDGAAGTGVTSEELTLLAGPSPAREASPTFEPLAGPLFGPLRFPDPMPGATRIRGATRTNTTLAPLAVSLAAPSRPAAAPATLASFWAFGG